MQRQPSVAVTNWIDAGWHEAVIDSPVSGTATTTAREGAAVIQRGWPPVAVAQLALGGSSALTLEVQNVLKATIHNSGGSSPCSPYQKNMSAAGILQMCISVRWCGPTACTTLRTLGHFKYRRPRRRLDQAAILRHAAAHLLQASAHRLQ